MESEQRTKRSSEKTDVHLQTLSTTAVVGSMESLPKHKPFRADDVTDTISAQPSLNSSSEQVVSAKKSSSLEHKTTASTDVTTSQKISPPESWVSMTLAEFDDEKSTSVAPQPTKSRVSDVTTGSYLTAATTPDLSPTGIAQPSASMTSDDLQEMPSKSALVGARKSASHKSKGSVAVSYTHLTLPTKRIV